MKFSRRSPASSFPPPYEGYASSPLTTAIGKTILAEFCYGGKVTLPADAMTDGDFDHCTELSKCGSNE
jgi:hypothetical protein